MPSCLVLVTALCVLAPRSEPAPAGVYVGRENQVRVGIPRMDGEAAHAVIDGRLDEDVWQPAALLTGFSQFSPVDGIPAADTTQVLVWYSSTAVYFGVRAFSKPGDVHASLADRDKITSDDNVQILLGTFNDHSQAYM